MRRSGAAIAAALLGMASPAMAAPCAAEAGLRADVRWKDTGCHNCMVNRVVVGPGAALRWNGAAVSLVTLRHYLGIVRNMNPVPFTELNIGPNADCGLLARVRATIEDSLPCERPYCSFALVEPAPPPPRRRRSRR